MNILHGFLLLNALFWSSVWFTQFVGLIVNLVKKEPFNLSFIYPLLTIISWAILATFWGV
jgi:hypothetical protein